jgi:hypothetical protein
MRRSGQLLASRSGRPNRRYIGRMDQRHAYFILGLLLLALFAGYVRDVGIRAGVSASTVATLEKLAIFA